MPLWLVWLYSSACVCLLIGVCMFVQIWPLNLWLWWPSFASALCRRSPRRHFPLIPEPKRRMLTKVNLPWMHTHSHTHTTLKMSTQIQTFHSGQCFCGFWKECSKQMGFLSMFLSPPSLAPLHTWNRHTGNFNANSCKLIPSCFVIIHAAWNACTSLCSEFSLRLWFLGVNCNTTEHWSFCFSLSSHPHTHSHNQNAWPNAHPLLYRNKI